MREIKKTERNTKKENRVRESLEYLHEVAKEKVHIKKSSVRRIDDLSSSIEDYKNIKF